MPQLAPVVLTDRSTTPVNVNFVPVDIAQPGSVAHWSSEAANLEHAMRLSAQARRTTTRKVKSKVTLAVPVLGTHPVTGQPEILDVIFVTTEITSALSTTEAARNNAIGMMHNAISAGKAVMNDVLVKGHSIY